MYFNQTDFFKALPSLDEHEMALMKELSEQLVAIRVPQYPEHMRELATLYSKSARLGGRFINVLATSGVLEPPTEKRCPGLCTIMFSDKLPE